MILKHTRMLVADNTGAKIAMCIGFRGRPMDNATVGRVIKVTIKEIKSGWASASSARSSSLTGGSAAGGATGGAAGGTGGGMQLKVRPGEVHNALVVRCRQMLQRNDGRILQFGDNAIVLLTNDLKPLGTKVFGPVPIELKKGGWLKILSLSSRVV